MQFWLTPIWNRKMQWHAAWFNARVTQDKQSNKHGWKCQEQKPSPHSRARQFWHYNVHGLKYRTWRIIQATRKRVIYVPIWRRHVCDCWNRGARRWFDTKKFKFVNQHASIAYWLSHCVLQRRGIDSTSPRRLLSKIKPPLFLAQAAAIAEE